MSETRRTGGLLATISAGAVIGVVEVVLAISFAALVFGGYLEEYLPAGIGIYLIAAALTLGILAWRAGVRGVVGTVQDAAAAVLGIVAASAALDATGSVRRAFLTVVAATVVVTLLTAAAFLLLGTLRLGNLARFIPFPVVGGFLAGTGWLLMKGGIRVAASMEPKWDTMSQFLDPFELVRWVPAVVFGLFILVAARVVKRPLVIPAALALGLLGFVIWMAVTGKSIQDARDGLWLLGPFPPTQLWEPWTVDALKGADWSAVVGQTAGILTTVFVAVMGCLFNVGGVEVLLHTDLDSNRELRDAGWVNVATGAIGAIPGYHALSLTALAQQMAVDGRRAGIAAALVPLAAVVFGADVVGLVPRMVVGGVLVFVGLSFLVAWIVDMRRSLPLGEYLIVLAILVAIATRGLMTGLVVGLILAVVLFAVNYGRIDLVREVAFGSTFRSNVSRPAGERAVLNELSDRVQILRLNGFVFFGTANSFLERIRKRVEAGSLRLLVIDLRRVTGIDSSGVLSFRKVALLAESGGSDVVLAGASERMEEQLRRGGVVASEGVWFEPDLDRALQRCEDVLLEEAAVAGAAPPGEDAVELPAHLRPVLERRSLDEGDVLIAQGDPSEDVFVLESGRLRVEYTTPDGGRMRISTVRPGVVVGEIALYTGAPRTADVIADAPCVVLALSRASIERLEAEDPDAASALHRWLATMLAARLADADRVFSASMD